MSCSCPRSPPSESCCLHNLVAMPGFAGWALSIHTAYFCWGEGGRCEAQSFSPPPPAGLDRPLGHCHLSHLGSRRLARRGLGSGLRETGPPGLRQLLLPPAPCAPGQGRQSEQVRMCPGTVRAPCCPCTAEKPPRALHTPLQFCIL